MLLSGGGVIIPVDKSTVAASLVVTGRVVEGRVVAGRLGGL